MIAPLSKKIHFWAIEAPQTRRGRLRYAIGETISDTRKGAKKKIEHIFKQTWDEIESNGWKCIKVIVEITAVN